MKCSDVDDDLCPSRDRENSCLTGSVSNSESSVLGTVLCNDGCLGQSLTKFMPKSTRPALTTGNILRVSYNVLHRWKSSHQNRHSDITSRSIRCDSVKSRDIFISLRIRSDLVSRETTTTYLLVGDRPEERLGYVGIAPLALLDAPQACSRRSQGCARMSIISLGSSDLVCSLDYPHLVSSDVENEHVSWAADI